MSSKKVCLFLINKIRELFKFSLVGAFVMLLSVVISYLFLELLKTPLVPTYILLYISTIFLSYKLNAIFTFKAKQDLSGLIKFYGVYIIGLALGSVLVVLFRKWFPFTNWVITIMVLPFTTLSNFILSTLIFKDKRINTQ
jgi:putative flippase GtrA